ncbi:MAG: hypothetical protein J0H47_04700 [Gammaproteobacteria bacterium]|nr:hypothetical protein [Gammaproteobacteria bacterium]
MAQDIILTIDITIPIIIQDIITDTITIQDRTTIIQAHTIGIDTIITIIITIAGDTEIIC